MPTGPDIVRRVLVEEQANFPKSRVMQRLLEPLIGQSMFLTNGSHWARQRRMVDPTLELSRLKAFLPLMQAAVDEMMDRLRMEVGKPVDIEQETMRVTADILCRTVFSEQVPNGFVDELSAAFRRYQALTPAFIGLEMAMLPRWCLPLHAIRARREGQRIRSLLRPLISERIRAMAEGQHPEDLLSALVDAEDPETGHRFTEEELVDEVAFFFLAGHETTASALSWSFYLIANDRTAQALAAEEIAREIPGGKADFSALRKLRYNRDIWREALRLYPPVTTYIRDVATACPLGNESVETRDLVAVTPWLIQRSPRNWSHPELFDPDRFSTAKGKASMRAAYVPFNTGPRVCSGAAFATQETLLIMAEVLGTFVIHPIEGREPEPVAWLTQRARNGIWLRLELR
nr:cytochrome P450 [Algicella marina]